MAYAEAACIDPLKTPLINKCHVLTSTLLIFIMP
jgi:hypothetical protein